MDIASRQVAVNAAGLLALAGMAYVPFFSQSKSTLPPLPRECIVKGSPIEAQGRLSSTRAALRTGELRILALGSSSTSGIGATIASAAYPARLRKRLQSIFPGKDIAVFNRGLPGETAIRAAVRMDREVERLRPHLVLWQLGTNAAVRRVELDRFELIVRRKLDWLRVRDIDVILINPQYVNKFKQDVHYKQTVAALGRIAARNEVGLIDRYELMKSIAQDPEMNLKDYLARDAFHMNDLGYRCMASYAAIAIARAGR